MGSGEGGEKMGGAVGAPYSSASVTGRDCRNRGEGSRLGPCCPSLHPRPSTPRALLGHARGRVSGGLRWALTLPALV